MWDLDFSLGIHLYAANFRVQGRRVGCGFLQESSCTQQISGSAEMPADTISVHDSRRPERSAREEGSCELLGYIYLVYPQTFPRLHLINMNVNEYECD